MSLQEFGEMLKSVTEAVYHFEAWQETAGEYLVWQETGSRSTHASNVRRETVKRIQVELYTEEEFSETPERLMETLEEYEIAFEDPVIEYDRDLKKFRYIWECEVI
ncbi:MAG: hypothetical protein NC541_15815 [bacterium]|nr:hypothetical protein [bacterium]